MNSALMQDRLTVMGLLAGAIAVIANWAAESPIDRSVLKA